MFVSVFGLVKVAFFATFAAQQVDIAFFVTTGTTDTLQLTQTVIIVSK